MSQKASNCDWSNHGLSARGTNHHGLAIVPVRFLHRPLCSSSAKGDVSLRPPTSADLIGAATTRGEESTMQESDWTPVCCIHAFRLSGGILPLVQSRECLGVQLENSHVEWPAMPGQNEEHRTASLAVIPPILAGLEATHHAAYGTSSDNIDSFAALAQGFRVRR